MKLLIVFLLALMLISCSPATTPATTSSTVEKVNTDKIAEDFVKSMAEYSDYSGANLALIRKLDMGYEKFDYVYRFNVNTQKLPATIKFIEVRLMILGESVTHNLAVEVDEADLKVGALTQSDCESKGGRLANNIAGALCEDNEKNIGDLVGFITPYVCCV